MSKLLGIIFAGVFLLSTFAAYAGDEWYLIYKKKDASFTKYKGPYDSRVECSSDRYSLAYDEEYLGCKK